MVQLTREESRIALLVSRSRQYHSLYIWNLPGQPLIEKWLYSWSMYPACIAKGANTCAGPWPFEVVHALLAAVRSHIHIVLV